MNSASTDLTFGELHMGNGHWYLFSGYMDELGYWNRALNTQEIKSLYSESTYSWSPGGETTSSITVQPSATTTYTVDVTSGTNTCQSDVTITVQPLPIVDLGADIVLCNGASQTLDAGSHSSYLWSTGATTQTIDVNTAGTYLVTVQDATGCEASDTLVIETLSVDITQNDTTICEGDSLVLEVNNSQLYGTLNNGIVGFWPFNGNANDESGNSHNGTNNGASLTTDRFGNSNSAYSFDGASTINIDHHSNLSVSTTGQITVSAWSKSSQVSSGYYHILGKRGSSMEYQLAYNNDGTLGIG